MNSAHPHNALELSRSPVASALNIVRHILMAPISGAIHCDPYLSCAIILRVFLSAPALILPPKNLNIAIPLNRVVSK